MLSQRRWFTIPELLDAVLLNVQPEFLIRWHVSQRVYWLRGEPQYQDKEREKNAGARHLMSLLISRWELTGCIERCWKVPKGTKTRRPDAWMARATQKGIEFWEKLKTKGQQDDHENN